uniref:ATP synthase subunit b n=1 Tax=Rhinopithecus roxellana TaxID=61622 RepID=A0A2K6R223_RHIRO
LVYVIRKYGASVAEFADKLNEQKLAQLEEDAIDLEKSQQALVQKLHYLFDVQRNNGLLWLWKLLTRNDCIKYIRK